MDTGEGRFKELKTLEELRSMQEEYPLHGGVFTKGEIVELKGSRFKIKTISPKELRLKLLPREGE